MGITHRWWPVNGNGTAPKASPWDPARYENLPPLPADGLDPTRYPVHLPGTWQAALVALGAGYRPPERELDALRRWTVELDDNARRAELDRLAAERSRVRRAAVEVLDSREVVAQRPLRERVHAHLAGEVSHRLIGWHLQTVPTLSSLRAEGLPLRSGGWVPLRETFLERGRYASYYSRLAEELGKYPARRLARLQKLGRQVSRLGNGYRITREDSLAMNHRRWHVLAAGNHDERYSA